MGMCGRGGRRAAAVMVLLAITGCTAPSTPAAPPAPSDSPTVDVRKAALAETAKSLPAALTATGYVVCSRKGDDHWQVAAYSDDFRSRTAYFAGDTLDPLLAAIVAELGQGEAVVRNPCGDDGDPGVSPLSPDGRRLAVQLNFPETSDPSHVGWLDLGTGAFTDITESSNKKGYVKETFSDKNPGFAADGSLWFLRDSQRYFSADANGLLTQRRLSLACFSHGSEENKYRVVRSVAVLCPATVHPSGRFAADPRRVSAGLSTAAGFELDVLADTVESYSDAPDFSAFSMQIAVRGAGGLRDCAPEAWIDATELLCSGAGNSYYTVAIDGRLARGDLEYAQDTKVAPKTEIAPATETQIYSTALTRDRGSLIVAAGDDDGPATLYRLDLTTPGDPVEIGPVPAESRDGFTLMDNYQQPVGGSGLADRDQGAGART
ncbi:hypothetical protein GCM10009850_055860 [Nonomuraea monospora]|uniref:Lipoprotein n=1 Tax=Nonomuraea monospora TaxID=568818 RepID=A0ABN3CKZ3_9ACTN